MSSLVESLIGPLLARDASGRSWLPALLAEAPRGREQLGGLVDEPGSLSMSLSVRGVSRRLGAFEYPVAPAPELVRWWVEHPERLTWPAGVRMSSQSERLRRALLQDEPPGARRRAQDRAAELIGTRSILSEEWWRFEDLSTLACLLMTDRLVLTVEDARVAADPTTPWYPQRTRLVRALEAARGLAAGRAWCSLTLATDGAGREGVLGDLAAAAPHLDASARQELRAAFLGEVRSAQPELSAPGSPSAR